METNRGTAFGLEFLPRPHPHPLPWRCRLPVSFPDLAEECQRVHTTEGGSAAISVFETSKVIWTRFIWGPPSFCWFVGRTQPPSAALSACARRGSAGLCAGCDSLQLLDFYFDLFNSRNTVSADVSLGQAWHVRELVMRQLCICVLLTKVLEPN